MKRRKCEAYKSRGGICSRPATMALQVNSDWMEGGKLTMHYCTFHGRYWAKIERPRHPDLRIIGDARVVAGL